MRPVAGLRPAEENPRIISEEAVGLVARAIREYGFLVPLVVRANGEVVAGHTRLRAAVALGLDTVPCVSADHLSDQQVREFRLVENATHDGGGAWDMGKLEPLISDLDLEEWFGPVSQEAPVYEAPFVASVDAPPAARPVAPVERDPVVRVVVDAPREEIEQVLQRAVDDPDGGLP